MKPIERAVLFCGGQSGLAERIGISPQVVHNWIRRGNVPADHCPDIEAVTQGTVTCEELRPDLAKQWSYLRGTTIVPPAPTLEQKEAA